MNALAEIDELACLRDQPKLEAKLEELRQQAMAEAIPMDLFYRVEERVRAVVGRESMERTCNPWHPITGVATEVGRYSRMALTSDGGRARSEAVEAVLRSGRPGAPVAPDGR